MPIIPVVHTAQPKAVKLMNTIRANSSANYRSIVPVATGDVDSARQIGSVLVGTPALANEWVDALLNRIAKVIITSKMYENPWRFMKKGQIVLGETIEEIFIDLIDGYKYDADTAAELVFKRREAPVASVFHVQNFKTYYPVTIQRAELQKAFISWEGVDSFISKLIEKIYTSYSYDEFEVMKYMLAKAIVRGEIGLVNDVTVSAASANAAVTIFKGVSNEMEFMSTKYNAAGVANHTKKDNQYLILTAAADAVIDVNSLATAFNLTYAEFLGHKITVDSFANINEARLEKLFSDEKTGVTTFEALTATEKGYLATISAVIIDEDWMQIYDNYNEFTEQYNAQGLYWNYFFHVWGTFSYSPFANAVAFTSAAAASITTASIAVTSKTSTDAYNILTFKPEITASGLIAKEVKFIQTEEMTDAGVTCTDAGVYTFPANNDGIKPVLEINGVRYTVGTAYSTDGTDDVGDSYTLETA